MCRFHFHFFGQSSILECQACAKMLFILSHIVLHMKINVGCSNAIVVAFGSMLF